MRFSTIDDVLMELDRRQGRVEQHEVAWALNNIPSGRQLSEDEKRALEMEIAAWELRPTFGKPSKWGTHYHPQQLGTRDDGSVINRPELDELDAEVLKHWSESLRLVTNPYLKARYADILWDLAHVIVPSGKRDYKSGQVAVEAYIEQASALDRTPDIRAAMALERAFQIAAGLNDVARVDLIADRLLFLARRAPLEAIGIWSMPNRCFLGNRKIDNSRHDQLTEDYELRLEEAALAGNGYACGVAADYLCKRYKRDVERTERVRVLRTLANTYERQAVGADAGTAIHWLSSVVELLEAEGMAEDAERLRLIIEKRGPEALAEMKVISAETTIDRQELDESIDKIIAVDDPFIALFRLARELSPRCDSLRARVKEYEKKFFFYSMIPRTIIGHDGQPKATIGSSETDLEGRMVEEAMHSFLLSPYFFHLGYVKTKERFAFEIPDLMKVLSASYLCSPEISESLAEGVQAYDAEDYSKTISTLIPQIEAMLRQLLKILGIPISKRNRRSGSFSEPKNMNDVLADPRVVDTLEEDLLFFLRVVFVDKRGWNLRNEFAHGALPPDALNQNTASIVIMALLRLAIIGPHGLYLPPGAIEDEPDLPTDPETKKDDLSTKADEG